MIFAMGGTYLGNDRIAWLDGLRGIAVLLVIAAHTGVARTGWWGVWLFFVISGFLVGGSMIIAAHRGRFNPLAFARRRFIRIFIPAAIFLGGYHLVMSPPIGTKQFLNLEAAYNFLFLTNYTGRIWLAHYWTLCVEAHFYIALAIVAALVGSKRWTLSTIGAGLLIASIAAIAVRLAVTSVTDVATHWQIGLFGIGMAARLIWMPDLRQIALPIPSPLQFVGRISFSIYIVHLSIIEWSTHVAMPFLGQAVLAFSLSIIAGLAYYLAIERPCSGSIAPRPRGDGESRSPIGYTVNEPPLVGKPSN